MPKKKVLQWRTLGTEEWIDYDLDDDIGFIIGDYEVGEIYSYDYRVIEREE